MFEQIRHASWLELLYDLVFVALIAQFTYIVSSHHTTIMDLLTVGLVGYMIFIAWWGTTVNRNLQDSEDHLDKLLVQMQMLPVFLMSLAMADVFAGNLLGFFASFALLRAIQIFLLLRLYRINPKQAPRTKNVLHGIAVATLLWLGVGFVSLPFAYVLAFSALAIDILAPLSIGKGNVPRMLNVSHMQERLGLFCSWCSVRACWWWHLLTRRQVSTS